MPSHSTVFNTLFGNGAPLEFVEPKLASSIERKGGEELLLPKYPTEVYSWQVKRPKKSPTLYRNIIAWYLKAAGLTGREIGDFLSISASRANQLALRTQKQIFDAPWNIANMTMLSKNAGVELTGELLDAHLLRGVRREMIAAEYSLDRCIEQDTYAISAALRLGRKQYVAAYDKVAGTRCPCRWCSCAVFANESLGPYWEAEQS